MTTLDPEVARYIREQARRQERLERRVQSVASAPADLRHAALDGAPIIYKDHEGNVVGKQGYDPDVGAVVTQHFGGQRPPQPEALFVDTGGEAVKIQHSGTDINGLPAPANVRHGIVHASQEADFEPGPHSFAGYLEPIDGSLTHRLPGGEWHFGVVWRSQSGLESDMSEIVTANVAPLVDTSDLEETLAEAEQIIADAMAEAQTQFDELQDRLDNFEEFDPTDLQAELAGVTQGLADARAEATGLIAGLGDRVDGIKIPDVSGFITQTEVDAAAAAAETAAKEHADLVAQGAEDNAIAEAEAKADAAQAAAEAAAKSYTDQQDAATLQTASEDATAKADAAQSAAEAEADRLAKAEAQAAQSAAEATAAQDALEKAEAARDAAIAASSDDATAKADAAQAAAEVAAAADALAKADAAQAEAIRQAALDATAKADAAKTAAENAAKQYADQQDVILKGEAAADAQTKADAAKADAEAAAAIHAGLVAQGAEDAAIAEAGRLHALAMAEAEAAQQEAEAAHTAAGTAWDHADAALTRAETAETNAITEAGILADAARAVADEAKAENRIKDTRDDNEPPSYYYAMYPVARVIEFKRKGTIGLPAAATGNYAHLISHISWPNTSGGPIRQEAVDYGNAVWTRVSTGTDTWGPWANKLAEAEAAAKQHADNLPKMLGGSTAPTGTAPNGSVWFRRDSNNTVIGRWERIGGSWVQQEVSGELIDNLEAGKITALYTEFAETVVGKLWTQLAVIDRLVATSAWIGGAMIGDDAVEAKHITASETLSGKVAEFLKLNVTDLVATGAQVDEGVINKLWVDGLVGLSATLARAIIAAPNLIPAPDADGASEFWSPISRNTNHPSVWIQGRYTRRSTGTIRLDAGEEYRFKTAVAASVANTRYYIQLVGTGSTPNLYIASNQVAGASQDDWADFESTFTVDETGDYHFNIYANHNNGVVGGDNYQWFRTPRIERMTDGSLIVEDTIRTRHLHVTKDMVGEFASFMHLVTDRMDVNALWADTAWLTAVEAASVRLRSVIDDWQTTLSGQGMEVISPEGQPSVQLGNFEETGLTLYQDGEATASMTDDGHMSGRYVSANEEFYYQGDELSDILALEHLPRGVVANGETSSQLGPFFNRTGLAYLQFLAIPGRLYKATISGLARTNGGGTSSGTYISAHVAHTSGVGSGWPNVTVNSEQEAGSQRLAYHPESGSYRGFEYSFYWTYPNPELLAQKPTRILFAIRPLSSGAGAQLGAGARFTIEDVGLLPEEGLTYSRGGSDGGTAPAPDPTPEPKPKTKRVKTYGMSWWRTWWQNGNIPGSGVGVKEAAQGRTPYFTTAGTYRSMIGFPSMTSDLSGADIEKIEVRARVTHSHAGSGGNVRLGTHSNSSRPSSYTGYSNNEATNTHFGRGQERWITLPSSLYNGFKNGTYRGVTMFTSSTSSTYYVQANPSRFAIRVTYRK